MRQIFDFEQQNPPVLNEAMLRNEQERRKLRRQTALLFVAGLLLQLIMVFVGYSAIDWYPWLTVLCLGYVVVSATGAGVIAVAYNRKGGLQS